MLMIRKFSIESTVAFCKCLYFFSHKKCHNFLGISETVHGKAKFQKNEFDKYATSEVSAFSITSFI